MINDDFPLPDTPVTQIKLPKGNFTSKLLRLFVLIFWRVKILFLLNFLLCSGILISFFLFRYWAVKLLVFLSIFFKLPCATTSPPWIPAFTPISITWSDCFIASSSCSTTITVLPRSLNLKSVLINCWLSFWCNPIEGSSNTYNTPVNPDPIWLANLILWLWPPDKLLLALAKDK